VDGQHFVPGTVGIFGDVRSPGGAGVVDEHIQFVGVLPDDLGEPDATLLGPDVLRYGHRTLTEFRGEVVAVLRGPGRQVDDGAGFVEAAGDHGTDALGRAGHQDVPTGHIEEAGQSGLLPFVESEASQVRVVTVAGRGTGRRTGGGTTATRR